VFREGETVATRQVFANGVHPLQQDLEVIGFYPEVKIDVGFPPQRTRKALATSSTKPRFGPMNRGAVGTGAAAEALLVGADRIVAKRQLAAAL
jgi:hypothetical protein